MFLVACAHPTLLDLPITSLAFLDRRLEVSYALFTPFLLWLFIALETLRGFERECLPLLVKAHCRSQLLNNQSSYQISLGYHRSHHSHRASTARVKASEGIGPGCSCVEGKGHCVVILAFHSISGQRYIQIELWNRECVCDFIRCQGSIVLSIIP